MEDGLPSRLVYDAIQDKDGFMWFATANGLCRYDGNNFKTYNTQNSPLFSNTITGISLDANNHLFIQSIKNDGSAYKINNIQALDLNQYKSIKVMEALPKMPFKAEQINRMIHDELGSIFF